jgi:hypothetical protein
LISTRRIAAGSSWTISPSSHCATSGSICTPPLASQLCASSGRRKYVPDGSVPVRR